jgi:hypothetical protein
VQARIETVKHVYGEIGRKGGTQVRSVSSPYLFSGLLNTRALEFSFPLAP